MPYADYIVNYDPKMDTVEQLTKRIFYALFIRRLKHKKPCVIFISGDSGEGKSWSSLKIQEILLEIQGIDIKEVMDDINVYIPLQYPEKLDNILFNKDRLKKVNILCVHEAREVVKNTNWQKFIPQAISDVNAMSREIKPLAIIIISQFIRNITKDVRYTLNYYIKASRPYGKKARITIETLWKDDRDLETPKLRKRKVHGYLRYPDGSKRKHQPKYMEINRPDREITDKFQASDSEAKTKIIKNKLSRLISEMQDDIGVKYDKVDKLVEWIRKHPENISMMGKRYKKHYKLKREVIEMYDFTKYEIQDLEKKLFNMLKDEGRLRNDAEGNDDIKV